MIDLHRCVVDASDWLAIHGNCPICHIPGFDPWSALFGNSTVWRVSSGIYGDLLHISDLQILPDCLLSCLVEMSGLSDSVLKQLHEGYSRWCGENRNLANAVSL